MRLLKAVSLMGLLLGSSLTAQEVHGEGVAETDATCSDEAFANELERWARYQASGFGETWVDVLSRFAAGIDSVGLNFDETAIRLTWNLSSYVALDANVATVPSLFAPIEMKLAESEDLQLLQTRAEEGDDWTVTVRYHREALKEKDSAGLKKGLVETDRLPGGTAAVVRAVAKGEAASLVRKLMLEYLPDLKADFDRLEGEIAGIGKRIEENSGNTRELAEAGAKLREELSSLEQEASLCYLSQKLFEKLKEEDSKPKLVEKIDAQLEQKKNVETATDGGDSMTGETTPFNAVLAVLAAATSNTPQLNAEVFYTGRSDLVGPDELGLKVQYTLPIKGARRYLDSEESFLRLLRTTLAKPETIEQRRRLAIIVEYSDVDDFYFDTLVPSPVDVVGGEKWKASLAYSVEMSRLRFGASKLEADDLQDSGNDRIRYELLAAYESFPDDPMRPEDRTLAQLLITSPMKGSGDLSLGLVWASEPEYLEELDFDNQLSARAGLVFKFGKGKVKDLL